MFKVVAVHWLRLAGKSVLTVIVDVRDQRDPIKIGDVLIDSADHEFTLVSIGHLSRRNVEDLERHKHEVLVTLSSTAGDAPTLTLEKKPA